MSATNNVLQLKAFGDLSLRERYQFGVDLAHAVDSNHELELPYVADGYKNPFRGIRRLGKIAQTAPEHYLHPYVITITEAWPYKTIQPTNILKDNQVRPRGSGVVTAQNYYGSEAPSVLEAVGEESTEVAYWLRQAVGEDHDAQRDLGATVLNELIALQAPDSHMWSVVIPEHEAKTEALRLAGFESLDRPTPYELGDGCSVPRQLWHKQV